MKKVDPIKSADKVQEILTCLEMDPDPLWRRIYLMFAIGIYTGLRISDIVKLQAKHLRAENLILIETKTGKQQIMPIHPVLQKIVKYQLSDLLENDYIFTPTRKRKNEYHITTRTAAKDMKRLQERFGLHGDIACHTLRKTFGYNYYKATGDIELLRDWLNHSSAAVTRRYIGMDYEEKKKTITKVNYGYTPQRGSAPQAPIKRGSVSVLETQWQDMSENGKKMGLKASENRKNRKQ